MGSSVGDGVAIMQATAQRECWQTSRTGEATSTRAPVDLVHLRRFTLGNRALELEVLQLFSIQAPSIVGRLQHAVTAKDWRDAAHTLKGSAGAIGAHDVASAAAEAELLVADAASWPLGLAKVQLALDEACAFITAEAL